MKIDDTAEIDKYLFNIKKQHNIFIVKNEHKFKNGIVPFYDIIDFEDYVMTDIIGLHNAIIELNKYLKIKGLKNED